MGETNSGKQLYIIDGHALVYRAYFALIRNPLTNSKGFPTSAVFGFANYLIRLIETYRCPYLVVALDSGKPTFRHKAYAQYKAQREEMPDDLKAQMPHIDALIKAFNIPIVKQEDLEADDLIGALTHQALDKGFEVFLVTRDKDLMQLIGPKVKMLAPEGTGVFQVLGVKEVVEKMGVGPEKIVDYLALIGDASDNIPGVPGVGPKTAIKILESAGSVDRLLENPSLVANPKLQQKIEENRERLEISRMLATLRLDMETPIELEHVKRRPIDHEQCLNLFREMEFTSLMKNPFFGVTPRKGSKVIVVATLDEVKKLAERILAAPQVGIALHPSTSLPRAAEIIGMSLALSPGEAHYLPFGHDQPVNLPAQEALALLRPILESKTILKTGHNLKQDIQVFRNYGIFFRGIGFDVSIAAYLIESGKRDYGLEVLASEWLSLEIPPFEALVGKSREHRSFASLEIDKAASHSADVVTVSLLLEEKLAPILRERNLYPLFETIELPLISVLAEIEWHGMLIDTSILEGLSKEYGRILETLSNEIYQMAGESLNLNSPRQISEVLFDKLRLPKTKRTKSGSHSTNIDELEKLGDQFPIVKKIIDYREVQKLLSTYIDALPSQILPASGRIHSSFNQTIAATGRLSSTSPNLQNIPIRSEAGRKIRQAFVAPPGYVLLSADYSQIELRILAHLSKDPFLIQAFKEDKDIHTQTASAIYGVFPEMVTQDMRRAAKTINFGLMYGMGPINLARQLGIGFGEAKMFIEAYFRQFPNIKKYDESVIVRARELGYTETLLGRRRYLPEIKAAQRNVREAAERTAINTPVQGTAADIIKIAMVKIHQEMSRICKDAKMLLQVHDELVFEVPKECAEEFGNWAVQRMACAYPLDVPIKVDSGIGTHWGLAH